MHTLSSREFGHNVSSAKNLARTGPVVITDRGEPAFVLMNIQQYRQLTGSEKVMSLLDVMDGLPDSSSVAEFEIEPLGVELQVED